jgi:putative tryptophan/tyrosine transport system substrate-binding protein
VRRRTFIAGIGGAVAWPVVAGAQQPAQIQRVGVLMPGKNIPDVQDWVLTFEQQLNTLGWSNGRNLRVNDLWGENDPARLSQLATELISSSPDVILAFTTPSLVPLWKQTRTIPIVFTSVSDPVAQGFVASSARPGGNLTGFANFEPNMGAKWLQLLKEITPLATHVSVMFNPQTSPYNALFLRSIETAAQSSLITVTPALLQNVDEIKPTFVRLGREVGTSLIVPPDTFTYTYSAQLVAAAADQRIPAIYAFRRFALDGGLASYSIDIGEQFRLAAIYIDRILKGAKPGELPIQMPTKFGLVINLKTAKALGLDVSPSLLARADEVIE